ncbi:Putative MetA-pathway of phenol degradation [Duganella sp. CF517]|uniref:transporter n=1 Tax=Duganella sp. CF517 TaxID=1881038 RepID=UPI0008C254B2|nr:transporter [Duganella sp. CF517]SEO58159.1 Putative MetA-pathway of phenol degradation [Duganella sp. CF517]
MAIKNIVAVLFMLPAFAIAADDEIATDRPDFVESSNVVGKGRFQIETSFAVDRNKADGIKDKAYSTPTLLRYGVGEDWEVRLETDGRIRATSTDLASGARATDSGYGDVSLGVKWHVADENGASPSMGVLAHVDLDTGSAPFRAQGNGGSLRLAAEWEFADDWSLGVMPGLAWLPNDNGDRHTTGIFGIVVGKGWTERLRTFVEYSDEKIARARDGGTISTLDVGAAYLLSKTVQIDTALSRGLNSRTPDWSWTVGLSMKF